MAVATVLEKFYGSSFAREHVYVALPVIVLWGITTFFALCYILRRQLYRQPATFCLHLALVVILVWALITHLSGKQGKIHLRIGEEPLKEFVLTDGTIENMPFYISLIDFKKEYYPGTVSPSDFISKIEISEDGEKENGVVSINNIFTLRNYRFYQSGFDADGEGSFLTVSYDPYGIAVTYTGYIWLALSIIVFFFQKKTIFRSLLNSKTLKKGFFLLIAFYGGMGSMQASPPSIPKTLAKEFGDLYIYYNDRVAPFSTFASDFTKKIYGKNGYEGLTPEQVVTGWFFFYDSWKREPFIKIKGERVKELLEASGGYASLSDFTNRGGYKLENALLQNGEDFTHVMDANEKFNIVSALSVGSLIKIYPYKDSSCNLKWLSLNDRNLEDMPYEQWLFIFRSMDLVAEKIAMRDWHGASQLIGKIKKYQNREGSGLLPSESKIMAEKFYNNWNIDKPLAMGCLTLGIFLFFVFIFLLAGGKRIPSILFLLSYTAVGLIFVYLTIQLGLRWYISSHLPLSNGFETMQFMGWCSCLLTLMFSKRYLLLLPFGILVCGVTLLVAMMGESSPQITNLMPVLHSPLLSIHVMVIMTAYTLLAFTMLNGIASILFIVRGSGHGRATYLQAVSRLIMYPAVFLLAIGIFVGAVWANQSWGRYWGWDPKEVWALITLLIYSFSLHPVSLSGFHNTLFYHIFCIVAFLSVVVTYFGVNFFLGGMHSYA